MNWGKFDGPGTWFRDVFNRFGIGVKVVVINNQWLGMVRQWQDMIYDKHRSGSDMSDPMAVKRPLIQQRAWRAIGSIMLLPASFWEVLFF